MGDERLPRGRRDITNDGTLPLEMQRAGRALYYHLYALAPLVMLAELGESNGIDLYAEKHHAIQRLVDRCAAGLQDPSYFVQHTGVPQDMPTDLDAGRWAKPDRDIEAVQTMIRNCASAGIPCVKYNMSILGVLRLATRTPGRGDSTYSTWRLADAHPDPPLTRAGHVDAGAAWERITYFLERVVPVAEEYKVRIACHPHDPGVPPEGYQGVVRVLGTVDGLKKFLSIKESPYHGLNFCQGTVSEMLADPGKEIFDVIRYFGSRQKIFNVHFRNIRGHRNDFIEVYPDEGDIDFVQAIKVYKEVGYPYLLMPDHVPAAPNDPGGLQSFAFCYGYIKALIQAVS